MAKRTTGRAAAKPAGAGKQKIRTQDSFQNFIARVGQGTGNQHDGSHYGFNPITRNRIQMEFAYRGSWVVGRVVDCVARDMTRERIDINTDADSADVKKFDKGLARMKMWSQLCLNIKWARLYGGSCAFMMIDGQDPATPLRPDTIGKGQFKGLLPMDRWLLQPSLQELVSDYGPHFGKPKFYSTVPDSMGMPLMTIHHTRMVRLDGVELPYWQKISENLWGQSVLERMWDRLLAFDSTTTGVAQLVYKAHLRTLKIPDLRGIIGQGGGAMNGVLAQVNMIRAMQTNEGLTLLDKDDEFDVHSYAFSGLDAVLVQFGEQLCGAVEIPAVRMFGQSPAGFNSGESDLRSYYDSIKQNQEADLGPELETVYKVAWLSEFGFAPPEEFDLEFEHLWQMDEVQKSQVTETTAKSITDAYEKQLLDRATGMRELKELGREVGTFSQITDESIKEAEADPPPTPEALGLVAPPKPEPGEGAAGDKDDDKPTTPEYKPDDAKPFKALDAAGVPQHKETGRFTYGMGLDEKRYDEKGKKDPDGEWADSPLDPVTSKSMREAIQAAHPHTCKAYGEQSEIEPWKLQGPQARVNIRKVGGYRADHGDPITVVKRAGEHGIVDGHHRAVAAHLQGRAVAANIVDMDRAFSEAADQEAKSPGLGQLGALHIATQLRLKNTPTPKRTKDSLLRRLLRALDIEWDPKAHPRQDDGKFGEKAVVDPYVWKKIGEKLGSNEGGTYEKNGKKYYVKFPANPDQARTEVLSAQLANMMGIETTGPVNVTIDGKLAVASGHLALQKINWADPDMTVATMNGKQRLQLARMYYHAKLTKNWDVLGVDSTNIMMDSDGDLVQMDTGGSFKYRAQGKHKDYGSDINDTNLTDPNMASGKVFNALYKKDPAVFGFVRNEMGQTLTHLDPIFDSSQVKDSTSIKFAFAQRLESMKTATTPAGIGFKAPAAAPPSVKSIEAGQLLNYHQQEQLVKDVSAMLERKKGEPGYKTSHQRLREAMRAARTLEGGFASQIVAKAIKCPPPPVTDETVYAVSNYVDSSAGLNTALRINGGALPSGASYQKDIAGLDGMMKEARDFAIPIKMVRGMPAHYLDNMKVGDTYVDHGYMSTSFAETIGKELFGKKAAVLNITIPKGFKFLSVPSFSVAAKKVKGNHAGSLSISEAEAILPRGTGLRIKSISKVGDQRVVDVEAVFSSIQPARDEWKSSKAAKTPYQFHPHLKPKEPGAP